MNTTCFEFGKVLRRRKKSTILLTSMLSLITLYLTDINVLSRHKKTTTSVNIRKHFSHSILMFCKKSQSLSANKVYCYWYHYHSCDGGPRAINRINLFWNDFKYLHILLHFHRNHDELLFVQLINPISNIWSSYFQNSSSIMQVVIEYDLWSFLNNILTTEFETYIHPELP